MMTMTVIADNVIVLKCLESKVWGGGSRTGHRTAEAGPCDWCSSIAGSYHLLTLLPIAVVGVKSN